MLHTLTRSARAVTAFTATTLCMAFFSIGTAHATKVYRWVDENGVVTYGDSSHRPDSSPSEMLKVEAPTPAASSDKKTDADKTKAAKKPADKPKPPEEPKMSAAEKRKLCAQARNDMTVIQSRGRLREVDDKGNVTAMTDEQKQARLKLTRNDITAYCR